MDELPTLGLTRTIKEEHTRALNKTNGNTKRRTTQNCENKEEQQQNTRTEKEEKGSDKPVAANSTNTTR